MPGTPYITGENISEKVSAWKNALASDIENKLTKLTHPGLLVIDMQLFFADPQGCAYLPAIHTLLPRLINLVTAFRMKGLPVLFTRHGHKRGENAGLMETWWKGRLLYEDEPQAEILEDLKPTDKMTVRKQHYNAFRDTTLAAALNRLDVETLVICGVMTDLCVETTARAAFMNGIQPVVTLDATAAKNEELHLAALRTLAHGCAYITTTDRIIELIS